MNESQRASETPSDPYAPKRAELVRQLRSQGITDHAVLAAMDDVPRHRFVPAAAQRRAYIDRPLSIGHKQTISQPFVVARMTELAQIKPGHRVLEIGTGSGYQAAVLAAMGAEVWSIEIIDALGERAKHILQELNYDSVNVRIGDGTEGWPEHAPFDAIIVTAAPPRIPEALKAQLKVGARMVIPVGTTSQRLQVLTRTPEGYHTEHVLPVRFVPMTGAAQNTLD